MTPQQTENDHANATTRLQNPNNLRRSEFLNAVRPSNFIEMMNAVGLHVDTVCTDFLGPALVEGDGSHDAYLHQLVWTAIAGSGMVGIMKVGLPGHDLYMRQLLDIDERIITTDSKSHEPVITDRFDWNDGVGVVWSSFPDTFYPEGQTLATAEAQQNADSKAHLHEHAGRYGVPLMHGGVAYKRADIASLVTSIDYPVRLKRGDSGCGGDWVRLVENADQLEQAVEDLYAGAEDNIPIVVEADAILHKQYADEEIVGNYCLTGAVGPDTESIFAVTSQLYADEAKNVWLGSAGVEPPEEHMQALHSTFQAYAKYLRFSCGYMGPSGPDLFVMKKKATGKLTARLFDCNARLPISAYSVFTANRLGYEKFINVNVDLPFEVTDFQQIVDAGLDKPPLVWLASRSTPEKPSARFKLFIGGHTPEEIAEKLDELKTHHGITIAQ